MMFQQESKRQGSDSFDEDEDEDFENGDNKKEGTELDLLEGVDNNKQLEDII